MTQSVSSPKAIDLHPPLEEEWSPESGDDFALRLDFLEAPAPVRELKAPLIPVSHFWGTLLEPEHLNLPPPRVVPT